MRHPIVLVAILVGLAGCTPAGGGGLSARPSAIAAPAVSASAASAAPIATASTSVAKASAGPTITCPLTRPFPAFAPPNVYPPAPASHGEAAWFGTSRLWTNLSLVGETWGGLPKASDGSFSQKTFWWRDGYDGYSEPMPAITVRGTRLDESGTFTAGNPGTNAYFDGAWSMLVGIDVPSVGCWQISGSYRGTELRYVVLVKAD